MTSYKQAHLTPTTLLKYTKKLYFSKRASSEIYMRKDSNACCALLGFGHINDDSSSDDG